MNDDQNKKNEFGEMKVSEHPDYKNITELALALLVEKSVNKKSYKYFSKALNFYSSVQDRQVKTLTEKQLNWLWELSCMIQDRKNSGQLSDLPDTPEEIAEREATYKARYEKIRLEEINNASLWSKIKSKIINFFK